MKKTLILFAAIFSLNFSFAQEKTKINFNEKKEVIINGEKIDKKTDLSKIKSILGEPEVYKEYPTGKINYHYPKLGISVHLVKDKLLFIGANFNWDGDKNFPETSYSGEFIIDNVSFNISSTESKLSEIKIVDIKCIMAGMCMTNPKEEPTSIIVGFKENKLTQIGFEFH